MKFPTKIKPMLCQVTERPFNSAQFIFEPKFDGERIIAFLNKKRKKIFVKLQTRNFKIVTFRYPEIEKELKKVKVKDLILDGEIVAFNKKGKPSFKLLQKRIGLFSKSEIQQVSKEIPVFYFVFDILWLDGKDLKEKKLIERKEILKKILNSSSLFLRITPFVEEKGILFFNKVKKAGFEGIVAKRKESSYLEGKRTKDWQKIKAYLVQEFVIGGWTEGRGARKGKFGSLLLGVYEGEKLIFVGHVGTGFDEKTLLDLKTKLKKIEVKRPPFDSIPFTNQTPHWVKPVLVCQVKFQKWTDSKLRIPVFQGLRFDKLPIECKRELK